MPLRSAFPHTAAIFVLTTLGPASPGASRGGEEADAPSYERDVRPFVQTHCVACHGADAQDGGLRLDTLAPTLANAAAAPHWVEVMDRLNLGEMPPEGSPRPDPHAARRVAAWIAAGLRAAESQALAGGGAALRRMNRTEYANTVRDLLGVRFFPGEGPLATLPPDGVAEGFDTVGAALTLDPSLLDQYFEVGQMVAERAIVDGPPEFPTETLRLDFTRHTREKSVAELLQTIRAIGRDDAIGILANNPFHLRFELRYPGTGLRIPAKGDYTVRLRAWVDPAGGEGPFRVRIGQEHPFETLALQKDLVLTETPTTYEFTVPRDPAARHWVLTFLDGTSVGTRNEMYWHLVGETKRFGEAGDLRNALRQTARRKLESGNDVVSVNPEFASPEALPKLWIEFFEVEGPLLGEWPPAGHRFLFDGVDEADGNPADARRMFLRLLPKAFRRPIDPAEAEPYVALVEQEMAQGRTFKESVRSAVAAALTSPSFLYLHEASAGETGVDDPGVDDPGVDDPGVHDLGDGPPARPLTGHELACRLSYFLWSSMPDDELFRLAESGALADPAELERQVDRMLADPKAEALVKGFAAQWLKTAEFLTFEPNQYVYKEYDEALGEAMVGEALAFFREALRRDEDVRAFADSDWAMLNERLATHYGVPGVTGEEFRRVPLPADSRRGGLLGMAGVALRGSDGLRSKPVNRAAYVREVLFNDPPDPPPPNAGEVEPNIKGENLTVRERLEAHRQIAACAGCHRTLDPYGLALENFNVVGRWRDVQDGEDFRDPRRAPPVDPSGTLPDGRSFETFAEFKSLLVSQDDRLCRGLAEKMTIYSLGRPLTPGDRGTIDAAVARMQSEGRTLRSLVKALVISRRFREK